MPKHASIFLPGGGNMGSLWPLEEEHRYQIIEDFRNCTINFQIPTLTHNENCLIPIKTDSQNFFATTNGKIVIAVISLVSVLIISTIFYIGFRRMQKKKENDNFYTDKFFTEYINKTSLITIID